MASSNVSGYSVHVYSAGEGRWDGRSWVGVGVCVCVFEVVFAPAIKVPKMWMEATVPSSACEERT